MTWVTITCPEHGDMTVSAGAVTVVVDDDGMAEAWFECAGHLAARPIRPVAVAALEGVAGVRVLVVPT